MHEDPALTSQALSQDLNRWPALRTMPPRCIRLWKILFQGKGEWITLDQLAAQMSLELTTVQAYMTKLNRALQGSPHRVISRRSNSRRYRATSTAYRPRAYQLIEELNSDQCPICELSALAIARSEVDAAGATDIHRHPGCSHIMGYEFGD